MDIKVKLTVRNNKDEPFMGTGPFLLLTRIKEKCSINKAAKSMNMSYVKSLRIVNTLEKNLKRKLLIKKIGGRNGGGTVLTEFAENLLEKYDRYRKKIEKYAGKEFESLLKEIFD